MLMAAPMSRESSFSSGTPAPLLSLDHSGQARVDGRTKEARIKPRAQPQDGYKGHRRLARTTKWRWCKYGM